MPVSSSWYWTKLRSLGQQPGPPREGVQLLEEDGLDSVDDERAEGDAPDVPCRPDSCSRWRKIENETVKRATRLTSVSLEALKTPASRPSTRERERERWS